MRILVLVLRSIVARCAPVIGPGGLTENKIGFSPTLRPIPPRCGRFPAIPRRSPTRRRQVQTRVGKVKAVHDLVVVV
ncbi:MAG: hypothetical protein MI861_25070, partial [Pirellulales bacterium]|nr:hypothetical protein [Pirellulales bacterium]